MASGIGADCRRIRKERERQGGMGRRDAARALKSEEFQKMKRSRIRHQQKSSVERRWRMLGGWRPGASGAPGQVGYASGRNEYATTHPEPRTRRKVKFLLMQERFPPGILK